MQICTPLTIYIKIYYIVSLSFERKVSFGGCNVVVVLIILKFNTVIFHFITHVLLLGHF